jgi:hypothetical protein
LYVMGGFFGAVIGIIAAVLLEKSSDHNDSQPNLSREKLTKLGFGTVSALWSLIDPGKGIIK